MRTARNEQPKDSSARTLPLLRGFAALLALAVFAFATASAGQTAPPKAFATTQKAAVPAHKRTAAAKPSPAASPAPEQAVRNPPAWPVNDQPAEAIVVWNSHGLRIDAANSSLQQILKDVSTATGAKVSGLGTDQRIFGTYGPGPARDVLSQLLDGSGYNVLMIGDQGQGTPRQLVLSRQPTGPAPPPSMNDNASQGSYDSSADVEEPQPPQPQPQPTQQPQNMPSGFGPGAQPRTPQQILQEMQQRQQQMQQQQQQTNPQ